MLGGVETGSDGSGGGGGSGSGGGGGGSGSGGDGGGGGGGSGSGGDGGGGDGGSGSGAGGGAFDGEGGSAGGDTADDAGGGDGSGAGGGAFDGEGGSAGGDTADDAGGGDGSGAGGGAFDGDPSAESGDGPAGSSLSLAVVPVATAAGSPPFALQPARAIATSRIAPRPRPPPERRRRRPIRRGVPTALRRPATGEIRDSATGLYLVALRRRCSLACRAGPVRRWPPPHRWVCGYSHWTGPRRHARECAFRAARYAASRRRSCSGPR